MIRIDEILLAVVIRIHCGFDAPAFVFKEEWKWYPICPYLREVIKGYKRKSE